MTRVRAAWMALPAWRGEASYPNCDVGPISLLWRSHAVGNGRIRTSADTAPTALACGRCLRQARSGYRLDGEPSVAEGVGLKPKDTGKIQNAVPAWNQASGPSPAGVSSPGQLAPSLESSGLIAASRVPQQGTGQWLARASPTGLRPRPRRTSARKPASPDPTVGRRLTMDKRPCRSLRPSGPDDRRATAAEGHRHARR